MESTIKEGIKFRVVQHDTFSFYKNQDCIKGCDIEEYYTSKNLNFFVYFTSAGYPAAYVIEHPNSYYLDGFYFPKILNCQKSIIVNLSPLTKLKRRPRILYDDKTVRFVSFEKESFVFSVKNFKE